VLMTSCLRYDSASTRLIATAQRSLFRRLVHSSQKSIPAPTSSMSWMDSWSRPSKHAVTPPPLYLTGGDSVPYCHSCGRVIGMILEKMPSSCLRLESDRCRCSQKSVDPRSQILLHSLPQQQARTNRSKNRGCICSDA